MLTMMKIVLAIFSYLGIIAPGLADDSACVKAVQYYQYSRAHYVSDEGGLLYQIRIDLTTVCFCPDGNRDCVSRIPGFVQLCDLDYNHCLTGYDALLKAIDRPGYCRFNACPQEIPLSDGRPPKEIPLR